MRFLSIQISIVATLFLAPDLTIAQEFQQLVGIPGLDANNLSTAGYINALYILSISVAAFLAVARIILAGVQYMLSDVVTDKGSAKKQITGALLGLLIVISAVLVLETINPRLTNWNVLDRIDTISLQPRGEISVILEEIDETGAINLEGLSTEEKTLVIAKKSDQCADKKVIVLINSVSCDNSNVTSGSVNTLDRFTTLVGNNSSSTINEYNQFISAVEPDTVDKSAINTIVSDTGGSDYLFVVKNFSSSASGNEQRFRIQQKAFCEERQNGSLVDSGNISVCVIE